MPRATTANWPNAALLPIGLTAALLELVIGVGAFDAIISEPFVSIKAYFSWVFLGLTQTYLFFIFVTCCVGSTWIVLRLCGVVQPWRSFARVAIHLFVPIVIWCFGQMCAATTSDGFYMGQSPPHWMTWSGFSVFASLWWYPVIGVVFVAWWIALMVRDDQQRSRQLHALSSSL